MLKTLFLTAALLITFSVPGMPKNLTPDGITGKWEGIFNGVVLSFDFSADKKFQQTFGGKPVQEGKWQLKTIKGIDYIAINSKKDGLALYVAEIEKEALKLTLIVGASYAYDSYTFGSDAEILELAKSK
ncbi:MAG: hypothetical protein A2014_09320 [Spirochaetes bacterium GWF1_49_6]|nr:MAG: hypothetical protein A2014_09320 [Spirochaetes bacterium GWF1_49_6]